MRNALRTGKAEHGARQPPDRRRRVAGGARRARRRRRSPTSRSSPTSATTSRRSGRSSTRMERAASRLCVAMLTDQSPASVADPFWPIVHGMERVPLPALPELAELLRARGRRPRSAASSGRRGRSTRSTASRRSSAASSGSRRTARRSGGSATALARHGPRARRRRLDAGDAAGRRDRHPDLVAALGQRVAAGTLPAAPDIAASRATIASARSSTSRSVTGVEIAPMPRGARWNPSTSRPRNSVWLAVSPSSPSSVGPAKTWNSEAIAVDPGVDPGAGDRRSPAGVRRRSPSSARRS